MLVKTIHLILSQTFLLIVRLNLLSGMIRKGLRGRCGLGRASWAGRMTLWPSYFGLTSGNGGIDNRHISNGIAGISVASLDGRGSYGTVKAGGPPL